MPKFTVHKDQFGTMGNVTNTLIIRRMHPCANYPNCEMGVCRYGLCSGFVTMHPDLIRMEIKKLISIISEGERNG